MENQKVAKKREFPHQILLYVILGVIACVLTHIIPAGMYSNIEGSNIVDPSSFQFIENTPVSLMDMLLAFQGQLATNGLVISLLLTMGATTEILIKSNAINSVVDLTIRKYSDKSIAIVVPIIYLIMTILGALNGNESMIAYIAIGMTIAKTLKIDRICAVAMFYLSYITAQAVGPTTGIILVAQEILGLQPLTGSVIRLVVLAIYYVIGATYVTRYALKVSKDPSKSVLGAEGCFTGGDGVDISDPNFGKFDIRSFIAIGLVIGGYGLFAYGSSTISWSWNHLLAIMLVVSVLIGFIYRMNPNEFCRNLTQGAAKMGPICLVSAFIRVTVYALNSGNIIHTITYSLLNLMGGLGEVACAVILFIFNLLFNFIVVGGVTQAQLVLPITMPMGDILGISRQVMSMILQFGDGLTNCMTPLSAPLMGALLMSGVSYPQWIKFVYKFVLCNVAIAIGAIIIAQTFGI